MRKRPLRSRGTFYCHMSYRVSAQGVHGCRICVCLHRGWGPRTGHPQTGRGWLLPACSCLFRGACRDQGPQGLGGCTTPHRGPCPLPAQPGASGALLGAGELDCPGRGPRQGQQFSLCPQLPHGLWCRRLPCASSSLQVICGQRQSGRKLSRSDPWPAPTAATARPWAPACHNTRGWHTVPQRAARGTVSAAAVPVWQRFPVAVPRWAQGSAALRVEPVPLPRAGQSRAQHSTSTGREGREQHAPTRGIEHPAPAPGTDPRSYC